MAKIIVIEGTLYPLLNRLKESQSGPPLINDEVTNLRVASLRKLHNSWNEILGSVETIRKSN